MARSWIVYWTIVAAAIVGHAIWWSLGQAAGASLALGSPLLGALASVGYCAWRGHAALRVYRLEAAGYTTLRAGVVRQFLPALGFLGISIGMLAMRFSEGPTLSTWELSFYGALALGAATSLALHRHSLKVLDDPAVKAMLVARAAAAGSDASSSAEP